MDLSLVPGDARIGALKDLNGYFPFTPSTSVEAWNVRKEFLLRQLKVACGLWPMPERPTIEATVHGRVERDDYTVDRVYFESSPGLAGDGKSVSAEKRHGKTADDSVSSWSLAKRSISRSWRCDQEGNRVRRLSNLKSADDTRSRPAAFSWHAWAVWSSCTTCSATPTAAHLRRHWHMDSANNGPNSVHRKPGECSAPVGTPVVECTGAADVEFDSHCGLAGVAAGL